MVSIQQALHEEKVYGPDLYDLIERLHEVNIAFSYQFRDLPAK